MIIFSEEKYPNFFIVFFFMRLSHIFKPLRLVNIIYYVGTLYIWLVEITTVLRNGTNLKPYISLRQQC